jgi:NAD+ kinase
MYKRVGILGRFGGASGASNPELLKTIQSIICWLEDNLQPIYVHEDTIADFADTFANAHTWSNSPQQIIPADDDLLNECDAVVVVGGDGTMLHAVQVLNGPVLIGVNLGRVGFITDIPAKHAGGTVRDLIQDPSLGKLRGYSLLHAVASRDGWPDKRNAFHFCAERVMNDIVITRDTSKLLELEVFVRKAHAFHVRGDGLLVSTPMGSTAYSLAAGGSIMAPGAEMLQIVPMMPQTLAHRPLIVSGDDLYVRIEVKNGVAKVEADGKNVGTLNKGDQIEIQYDETVQILRSPSYSYYDTLRTKLNWHLEAGTKPHENY